MAAARELVQENSTQPSFGANVDGALPRDFQSPYQHPANNGSPALEQFFASLETNGGLPNGATSYRETRASAMPSNS